MRAVAERQDRQAFAAIFDHFTPRLEAYLQRLGLSPAEAEDVAQDVMTTLWVKAAMFDPAKSSLATWIYRIARNRRIDRARRERAMVPFDPQMLDQDLPDEARPGAALENEQRDALMRAALVGLPSEQRQLVQLSYYDGLSQSEIAARAALPLGTVKSRLRLAFNRLRVALAAHGVTDAG